MTLLEDEVAKALKYSDGVSGFHAILADALSRRRPGSACRENDISFLPLAVCQSLCGEYDLALPAAAAFHLLLAAADVFDDLEDADSADSLAAKYGGGLALNAGAALIFMAEKALSGLRRFGAAEGKIAAIMETLNTFYIRACAGQHLDIAPKSNLNTGDKNNGIMSENEYFEIAEMKSAAQFESACRIGAMLGTEDANIIDKFSAFGRALGTAAQIADDIQGVVEGQDILNRKITLPIIYALDNADTMTKNMIQSGFSSASEENNQVEKIKEALFQCGAVHYAAVRLELCRQQAREILAELGRDGIGVDALNYYVEPILV